MEVAVVMEAAAGARWRTESPAAGWERPTAPPSSWRQADTVRSSWRQAPEAAALSYGPSYAIFYLLLENRGFLRVSNHVSPA